MRYIYQNRVMVVDSDSVSRHLLSRLLRSHNFQNYETNQYQIAIRNFIALKPGLIFLGYHLEGLNGLEVACFIRRITLGKYAKIYLHTTMNPQDIIDDPNYACIDGCIKKGDITAITSIICKHLDLCKEGQEKISE